MRSFTKIMEAMRLFFYLMLVFSSMQAVADYSHYDVRCFSSDNGRVNFKLVLFSDKNWSGGYVKYQRSQDTIPITVLEESSIGNSDARPDEISFTWVEVLKGKTNGKYVGLRQGANFYEMNYVSIDNKKTSFFQNNAAYRDDECYW